MAHLAEENPESPHPGGFYNYLVIVGFIAAVAFFTWLVGVSAIHETIDDTIQAVEQAID